VSSHLPLNVAIEPALDGLGDEWSSMVFPAHRPLLALAGTGRPDAKASRYLARCARVGHEPIGLALAELSANPRDAAEILSVYVAAPLRNGGIATRLLQELEQDLVRAGAPRIVGVYMTGKPAIRAVERVFAKCGFDAPVRRTIAVRFTPEEPSRCVWYQKARMPDGATIFAWNELTAGEREWLQTSPRASWIHPELQPWRFDEGFDPVSSVGMRKDGEVVGWAVNHVIAPGLVRFTVASMRPDLAARGASFPLYVASLQRLQGTGVMCTFVTAALFPPMNRFILRRVCPFVTFCGETRVVSKRLGHAADAGSHA